MHYTFPALTFLGHCSMISWSIWFLLILSSTANTWPSLGVTHRSGLGAPCSLNVLFSHYLLYCMVPCWTLACLWPSWVWVPCSAFMSQHQASAWHMVNALTYVEWRMSASLVLTSSSVKWGWVCWSLGRLPVIEFLILKSSTIVLSGHVSSLVTRRNVCHLYYADNNVLLIISIISINVMQNFGL